MVIKAIQGILSQRDRVKAEENMRDIEKQTRPKEWLEGRQAFMDGIDEDGCPYSMDRDTRRWSNWVSGLGEAKLEAWLKKNGEIPYEY